MPRRRCSTAAGQMIMQAEHIPVHLGAMPAAVEAVLGEEHAPGVSWILNDPFRGGTHLPDITVISPVFDGVLIGFAVESRPPRGRGRARAGVDAGRQPRRSRRRAS